MKHDFRYPTIIKHGNKYNIYISTGSRNYGKVIFIYNVDLPITKSKCLTNYISIIEEELVVHNFTVFKDKYLNKDFILMLCKFPLENKLPKNFGLKFSEPKTLLYLPL